MGIIKSSKDVRNIGSDKLGTLPFISVLAREKRINLGLSQIELAKKVGVGLKTLRKIEQGDLNVNYTKLNYLLNCLGLYLVPSEIVTSPAKRKNKILKKEKVIQTLRNILPILKIRYGIFNLALFGSYAMGTQTEDSDIDILISFTRESSFEIEGEIQLILENLFEGVRVELTIEENLHKSFREHIMETKIEIKE